MSEFRILDYNYAFDPSVTITATGSDSNFPVSNLARYSRARVWRSASVATTSACITCIPVVSGITGNFLLC